MRVRHDLLLFLDGWILVINTLYLSVCSFHSSAFEFHKLAPDPRMVSLSGKERREEQTSDVNRGLARQTTADEWNEIADIIKEEKKQRPEDPHMDPKQLSGITSDDPLARADYKRKLNALANLMTDVNLDESKK